MFRAIRKISNYPSIGIQTSHHRIQIVTIIALPSRHQAWLKKFATKLYLFLQNE